MNLIGTDAIERQLPQQACSILSGTESACFDWCESRRTAVQAIQGAAPAIAAFQRDRTLLTMLSLYLPSLPLHQQLTKVQLNRGAASNSCHSLHNVKLLLASQYQEPFWFLTPGVQLP